MIFSPPSPTLGEGKGIGVIVPERVGDRGDYAGERSYLTRVRRIFFRFDTKTKFKFHKGYT